MVAAEVGVEGNASTNGSELNPALRAQLTSLYDEGHDIWDRFDADVRRHDWHPFVPADYNNVEKALLRFRSPGRRFLEFGSATGVITIMADLLGFEAFGIEIDPGLVNIARRLADRFKSGARFANGSYLPAGYEWKSPTGDRRLGTIGRGMSAYGELQHPLEDFDLIFAYPWSGEEPILHDLIRCYARPDAQLLMYTAQGVQVYQRGRPVAD